jgi:hypothetical protein
MNEVVPKKLKRIPLEMRAKRKCNDGELVARLRILLFKRFHRIWDRESPQTTTMAKECWFQGLQF